MEAEALHLIAALSALVGFALSIWASAHALLHKRRPRSALAWLAVSFSLPFVGPLLYYLLGINRVRTRAKKLLAAHPDARDAARRDAPVPPQLKALAVLGRAVTDLPLLPGNSIEVLHNGEAAFPAMLNAIRGARTRVFLSTYIFDSGPVGKQFCTALAAARDRGVDVRVLLDGVGELYSRPRARHMLARAGIPVGRFLPPRLWPPAFAVNLRNHRKMLVIDSATAFTGGVNIREHYLANATESVARIKDIHFRLDGPIVEQIESVFAHDWQFVTGESCAASANRYEASGPAICRAVADGPHGDMDRLTELLVGAIGKAQRRIAIMTPYFLPPRELIAPLEAAALQGIDLAIILPEQNNLPYVHRATRHMLWELLERGAHVYYQPPPFVHSKFLLIDDDYAQIGSANLDTRSLRLNFELNVEVYDRGLVGSLGEHFAEVRHASKPVTLTEVDARPLATKLVDGAAWLFSPYL